MNMSRNVEHQHSVKPSRLQLLQVDFQRRQLQEKERKLLNIHLQSQKNAEQRLDRITQTTGIKQQVGGGVRDFFKNRNETLQNSNNNTGNDSKRVVNLPHKKNSAGRDKSNPLAPIQRNVNSGRKQNRVQALTEESRRNSLPSLNSKNVHNANGPYSDGNYSGLSDNGLNEEENAVNFRTSKQTKRRKQQSQKHLVTRNYEDGSSEEEVKSTKLSNFQLWQLEQDEARRKRLEKHRMGEQRNHSSCSPSTGDQDDFAAEIAQKERELLAQIEKRQKELAMMEFEKEKEKQEMKEIEQFEQQQMHQQNIRPMSEEVEIYPNITTTARTTKHWNEETQHNPRPQRRMPDAFPTKAVAVKHKSKNPNRENQIKSMKQQDEADDDGGGSYQVQEDSVSFYVQAVESGENEDVHLDLRACPNCGRKFNADRLNKHAKACKNITKKRKVMDPVKMRVQGTDAAKYASQINKEPPKRKNKVDWRKQHKEFIEAIRYAKKCSEVEAKGGSLLDLPPPPRSENAGYKECPYCKRKFNPDTAERHIPKCKDIKARPAPPKKKR